MKDLIILNYSTSEVHVYKANSDVVINEAYISDKLGMNPDECSWMFGDDITIVNHKEILR